MLKNTFFLLILAGGLISASAPDRTATWTGEIMDAQCGLLKSHSMMKKQLGAADDAECTRACARQNGKVVLLDSMSKKIFQLDDQQKAANYAGKRVQLVGMKDPNENAIHIKTIRPL